MECLPPADKEKSQVQQSWLDFELSDHVFKFKFLTLCESRFHHVVPSSDLHAMKRVRDVLEYYSTPVRGTMTYDALARDPNLPENLHILPEIDRWKPEERGFFSHDAMPGHLDSCVKGIRAKRKYKPVKTTVVWPDI